MKVLLTGFTSRGVGSDQNTYDYFCNIFALKQALILAGHDVDQRPVSLETDPCIEEDYDVALVGVAACQGLSSKFKLGGMWTLARFGPRAGLFPSDGKNVGIFPSSVLTCLSGVHKIGTPLDYFLQKQFDGGNILDVAVGNRPDMLLVWNDVLERLPHSLTQPTCEWPALFPLHAWGRPNIYGHAWGCAASGWDPTNVAIPMQFGTRFDAHFDGRYMWARDYADRQRSWVLASLQDNGAWLKKIKPSWSVVCVGNKRAAKAGKGVEYVPEEQIVNTYYRDYAGTLSFGYPLGHGGWWRMRLIHAALAGCVTCCDENDARSMPDSFQHSRIMLERWSNEKLAEVALQQHEDIKRTAWTEDHAVNAVNEFVTALKG